MQSHAHGIELLAHRMKNIICGTLVNCQVVRVSNICVYLMPPVPMLLNTLLNRSKNKCLPIFSPLVGFGAAGGDARPVWRYISGRGGYSRAAAGLAILHHRAQFSTASQLDQWACRAYFSCTMWGAAAQFDDLLSSVGWCPF